MGFHFCRKNRDYECGPYSVRVLEFIEDNSHNPKFSEYADIIISSYPNHGVA